ncbi:MAG: PAS domain S-box protein, partial [Methanomicrobiales archaeon]|nr:PAS domain S-box protein [Methanomicrobiales archaeon]
PVEYHEKAVLTKTGQVRVIAFHNSLVRNEDATISGILFSGEDITLRHQMEDALRQSEERFRNLIQNSSDMIRIIGKDGLVAYSSPSTLQITGCSPDFFLGKNPLDFVHPDDRPRVESALGEVFSHTNPGIPTEYRIRHASGTWIDVEAIATNLVGVAGIDGVVTTTRPITERKNAELALRESEGRYRAIFEKSRDAIIVLGKDSVDCNPRAEELFQCSRDDLLGFAGGDFSFGQQPCGRSSADLAGEYLDAAGNGSVQSFSWIFVPRGGGKPFPAHVTLLPAQVRGEKRIIALIQDTSVQGEEDRQARHLARFPAQSPFPVIEITANGEVTYANPASREVLRSHGMPSDPAAYIPADFPASAASGNGGTDEPCTREVTIGTARFAEMIWYDREDDRYRMTAYDITKRSYEIAALEQANRKLNTLSGIIRHDIKNKLTGVMGYLELAQGSTRDPEILDYLGRVEVSANAVRQQVEFTKQYENLGTKPPCWQALSVVLSAARKEADCGALPVTDETGGLEVYADPMLVRVFAGLIENAVMHGGKMTAVRVHGSAADMGYLLVVEDDGNGVPREQKEKIFNKASGKGTMIGLFLSREILSLTGITLKETGEPGTGARFEFFIPSGKFRVK